MTDVGGRCDTVVAAATGTPWAVRPCRRLVGSDDDRPAMIRLKKTPIDRTIAEFWKVLDIPEPTPRRSAGRLFMMPARFGEANRPLPMPLRSRKPETGPEMRKPPVSGSIAMPAQSGVSTKL